LNLFSRFFSSKLSIEIDEIKKNKIPLHVAVIMDGNGRWASRRGLPRIAGHREGVKALKRTVEYCSQIGVKYLTAYSFSSENWNRPKKEVSALMDLFYETVAVELNEMKEKGVRIFLIGDRDLVPVKVLNRFIEAEKQTQDNKKINLSIAFNYGSRQEIVNAVRQVCKKANNKEITPQEITEDYFSSILYTSSLPDPDLLIRTSGEFRISNFLLWQIAYSELYFTKTLWPDFGEEEFLKAISEYQQRNRRFGKI